MKIVKVVRKVDVRWNRKEYQFYVVLPDGKIDSGWVYKEDAKDALEDIKEAGVKGAKIVARKALRVDPEDSSQWHTGDYNALKG